MYGLFLYGSQTPRYVGTKSDCRSQVDRLTTDERIHGWTIKPYAPHNPLSIPQRINRILWAAVGFGILFFVAVTLYLALRGHFQ